jgi:predicted acylesterase/phospholipase RssA/CRP-like cAMP-binding protein
MFAGAVPWLPSLRGTVLVSAMLVGAYGTDAGLAATALLLMAFAAAAGLQIAAGSAWRWVRGARRRVSDIKLLDDGKMKTFQRATLQIFDLPHHPRRLRQAVRRWREWRLNSDVFSPGGGAGRRANKTSRDRPAAGDGFLGAPHDGLGGAGFCSDGSMRGAQGKHKSKNKNPDSSGYFGFMDEGERFMDDGAFDDPPDARPSDGFASARAALASCDVCRCFAPDVIAKLALEHMREVHIAAGEDVFRGRVRDDELAVLVSGAVAVGEFVGTLDGADAFSSSFFEGGGATVIRDRGVALNSLLDVLEGSEHAHVAVHTGGAPGGTAGSLTHPESPRRAGSAAGGAGRGGREADPSLNPFGDDQLVSAAAEAAAAASKAAAEAANELANEAVLDSFRPVVKGSAAASPAGIKRLGVALAEAAEKRREPEGDDKSEGEYPAARISPAHAPSTRDRDRDPRDTDAADTAPIPPPEKASSPAKTSSPGLRVRTSTSSRSGHDQVAAAGETRNPSPLGVAALAAVAAAARDADAALAASVSPAPSADGASDLADASASAGSDDAASDARAPSSSPATPTRSALERLAEGEARRLEHLVSARDSVSRPGTPGRVGRAASRSGGGSGFGHAGFAPPPSAFAAADFSGGPGGLPRLRARGAEGGCVIAAVPLRAFHRAAGFQLGIQAPAMRLCGGYHALCHYLRAPGELGALWVDPAPTSVSESRAGATLALARLLGAEAARAVDRGALEALLERRGYAPRRAPEAHALRDGDSDGSRSGDEDAASSRGSGYFFNQTGSRAGAGAGPGPSTPGGSQHGPRHGFFEGRRSRAGSGVEVRGGGARGFEKPSSRGGSASAANSARGGAPVELEAMELAPGEAIRFRSAAAAALLVERGSLEGYVPTPSDATDGGLDGTNTFFGDSVGSDSRQGSNAFSSRSRGDIGSRGDPSRASGARDGGFGNRSVVPDGAGGSHPHLPPSHPPAFVARAGSCVGEFLLLTGQRAAVTLRAGADGAVVAALPHSAVARLVRTYPSTYARVATRIARRLRPSLPARAWDRCGARWIPLGAGQTLADRLHSARAAARRRDDAARSAGGVFSAESRVAADASLLSHSGAHPEGVYVVVTGCVRLAAEDEEVFLPHSRSRSRSRVNGEFDAYVSADHPRNTTRGISRDFDDAFAKLSADGAAGARAPRFLGPGDAVGEEAILRDASWKNANVSPKLRASDVSTTFSERSLRRARAVRESQLLWIPASSLESLATSAPRAFAALAWRMGARAGESRRLSSTTALSHPVGVGRDANEDDQPGVAKSGSASTRFARSANVLGSFDLNAHSPRTPRAVAVVPVSEGAALALDEFCAATLAALRKSCAARVADSAARLAEVGQAGVGPLANEATAHWLAQCEAANDVVLLKADPFPSPWCAQCARHADTILLVASAEDPAPTKEEGANLQARLLRWGFQAHGEEMPVGLAQRELVLLHASAELAPTGTRAWLEAFSVHRHHHLARAPGYGLAPAHASRLARSLRRHSVGLVLAGGGARGFAHVGVLMALEEEGVPVDMLGGTSMGSFVGGVYAKEPTALLTRIIARRLAVHMSSAWEQALDLTLPIVSYFSGFRMNRALEPLFRGAKIEDCWLPFFCLTLDLISCVPVVHRAGAIWRYVRASMALVGFLPPVCETADSRAQSLENETTRINKPRFRHKNAGADSSEGKMHVLVDGGYVNNLPTDVMRAMGARVVIAVDVSGRGLPETRMKPWGDAISGVSIFFRNVFVPSWLGGGPTCPTMAQMQSHLPFVTDYANAARRVGTVDIMVRPAVADVPILAFGRYAEIVRAGHEAGLRAVRAWKLANPEAAPLLDDGLWRPNWGAQGTAGAGEAQAALRGSGGSGGDHARLNARAGPGAPRRATRRGPGSRDFLSTTFGRPASHLADPWVSDDGGDSETETSSRRGRLVRDKEERDAEARNGGGGARRFPEGKNEGKNETSRPSAGFRRGIAEWFLGGSLGDDESGADKSAADELVGADPTTTFSSRDVRGRGGNASGFFSPDQPAPSMRQRHRYNSYQSGLDGDAFHHPHS